MNIGKAIIAIRKARKMTQKELADRCGLSRNALVSLEKNRSHPSMSTLKRLQAVLDVPQSYILLHSIEDVDIPKDKLTNAKLLLNPLKEYLI